MMREKRVRKEQIVLYQGEALSGVYVISEGIIRAYSILGTGSEINIALYGPGDYFPVETAYHSAPATLFYYEALTDCVLHNQTNEDFQSLRAANDSTPAQDSKRYVGALLHVNALGQANAYEKLGHTLRYLAIRFGMAMSGKGFVRINIRLTQQDLANLCTMSRETVSIELAKLKAKNAVSEKLKLYTVNLPQLNSLLGEDNIDEIII
ncbi:Crp/Fnr family transcriptional regulator [Candidatus Saccharibacteria bacterium]|nr:MAG: Crp/Fnr family transcriptional regulator [Candidatus Saccharibacteria bacterium]